MLTRRLILTLGATTALAPALAFGAGDADPASIKLYGVVIGQSNESGPGRIPHASQPPAAPMQDPLPPNGGFGTWWPLMATELARHGVALRVWNSAVGATSLASSWVGVIALWRPNFLASKGALILIGGHLWKCVGTPDLITPSTSAPASTPGPDRVEWVDVGPAPPSYRIGQVLREGDLGFDPNGYLRHAAEGFAQAAPDEKKVAFISIGQGDKTLQILRPQYSAALTSAADYMLAHGAALVLAGFPSPVATPGGAQWYLGQLHPAWEDFLETRRDDRRIGRGADLTAIFGTDLPVAPAAGPGLRDDKVHLNEPAFDIAGAAWAKATLDALRL